jgi:hypothetical protein
MRGIQPDGQNKHHGSNVAVVMKYHFSLSLSPDLPFRPGYVSAVVDCINQNLQSLLHIESFRKPNQAT